jgi:hypothetical protein
MDEHSSKRAEILKRLLPYINSGNYTEYEDFIIFGASSVEEVIEYLTSSPNEREDRSLLDALSRYHSDLSLHRGREHAAKRLSLDQTPSFESDAREKLSQFSEPLVRALDDALQEIPPSSSEDQIDAAFAAELLGKLPRIVSRAACFDQMSIDHVTQKNLRYYFHEESRLSKFGQGFKWRFCSLAA